MKEYTALEFRMIQKAMQFFQENPTVSPKAIAAYVGPSAQKGFIHILKRALACIRPADINPR